MTSSTLNVVANTVNIAPKIDWYSPTADTISVDEGASIDFNQISSDPNGDTLSYSWTLDTIEQATTQNWTYTQTYSSQGPHTIRVTVSDSLLSVYHEWTVAVADIGALPTEGSFDFGTSGSPVAAGYTQVTESTTVLSR